MTIYLETSEALEPHPITLQAALSVWEAISAAAADEGRTAEDLISTLVHLFSRGWLRPSQEAQFAYWLAELGEVHIPEVR